MESNFLPDTDKLLLNNLVFRSISLRLQTHLQIFITFLPFVNEVIPSVILTAQFETSNVLPYFIYKLKHCF